ncbi:MAG: EVE domain-containing protein [Chitinophagaceae bacterium]
MTKYFLICATKDHVMKGVEAGFAQAGHGRKELMSKPSKGDWIVYYSSKDKFENGKPIQKFTAIGKITDDKPYQPDSHSTFKPYRRNVKFKESEETDIRPLLDDLGFIKNKKRWGFYLISGFREISKDDFDVIKNAMK